MENVCAYCGCMAEDWDHIIPQAVVKLLGTSFNMLVPACHECNCIAGYHLFASVRLKRKFIQAQLKKKYAKLLRLPEWSDDELEEMAWTMRVAIEAQQLKIRQLRKRIAYNADDVLILGGIGNVIALRNAVAYIRRKIKDV